MFHLVCDQERRQQPLYVGCSQARLKVGHVYGPRLPASLLTDSDAPRWRHAHAARLAHDERRVLLAG